MEFSAGFRLAGNVHPDISLPLFCQPCLAERKQAPCRKLFAVLDSDTSEHTYIYIHTHTYIYIYLEGTAEAGAPAESSLPGQCGFKAELVQTLGRAQAIEIS